jgi:rubrerythrin
MSKRKQGIIPEFKSLVEILEEAVTHEQESHDFYLEAAKRTQDPDLQRFLRHLAEVELTHKADLEERLEIIRTGQDMVNDLIYAFGDPPL